MRKLTDNFSPPQENVEHRDSADLLRCGWNRHKNRCQLPGSIKPQGESHHLCRWHGYVFLFCTPATVHSREAFDEWLKAKRPTWIPVSTVDVWLRPDDDLWLMTHGGRLAPATNRV